MWQLTRRLLSETFRKYSDDRVPMHAGCLAFYTMLSIAPMLVITVMIVGAVYSEEAAAGHVELYLRQAGAGQAAEAIEEMIQAADRESGTLATILSLAIFAFSATYVFVQLKDSFNLIWGVKPDPELGWWVMVRDRVFSFALVLAIIFLLLVSLLVSTVISAAGDFLANSMPGGGVLWQVINFLITLGIIMLLFTLMFRYVPDTVVRWRDVWVGAAITAVLFVVGKFLLSWYLGRAGTTSIYGAAGSLVALLLWAYYTAQIVFTGAEFTQAWAKLHGRPIQPGPHAVPIRGQEKDTLRQSDG